MFSKPNQYAMINGFKVRVKDARQQDRNHLIEIDFELPLVHELADDILPAMAADLFERVNGEWTPKPEINECAFAISPDPQILEVREHPDMVPVLRINGVTIRRVVAYKGEANSMMLGFTATWTLATDQEATAMLRRLKLGVYLTCQLQQPGLAMDQDTSVPAEQQGADVNVDKGGVVTNIRGRGRRRGGQQPAADAATGDAAAANE